MEQTEEFPVRKRNRLEHYDYSSPGAYFITVCTKDRKKIFWEDDQPSFVGEDIILPNTKVHLTAYGKIVDEAIRSIPNHYDGLQLLESVIMPNHIHLILFIPYKGGRIISSPTEINAPSVLKAVGQMKRYVSKKIGVSIWQRSFHDHVIRDREDYEKIATYIRENPIKWQLDCFYSEE